MKKIFFIGLTLAILGIAYYGVSPLFKNVRLDEAEPGKKENIMVQKIEEQPQANSDNLKESPAISTPVPTQTQPEPKIEAALEEPALKKVEITGTFGHPASGFVRLIQDEEKVHIRYEDFKTINGPDLFVYLSKEKNARDFINLGRLKATEGNINYEVPAGIDIKNYPYALVWCRAFSVLFNSANLTPLFEN